MYFNVNGVFIIYLCTAIQLHLFEIVWLYDYYFSSWHCLRQAYVLSLNFLGDRRLQYVHFFVSKEDLYKLHSLLINIRFVLYFTCGTLRCWLFLSPVLFQKNLPLWWFEWKRDVTIPLIATSLLGILIFYINRCHFVLCVVKCFPNL